MKCFVSMLLIVIMLLSLSGCGAKMPTPPSEEALAQTDATFASEENSTDPTVVEASDADMLTKEKLSVLAQKGDLDEMRHLITTVKDCMELIVVSGIKEGGDNSSIEAAFSQKVLWPDKIIDLACQILEDDYEELGRITTLPGNYHFLYVKQDGIYSFYDVLKATHTGRGGHTIMFDSGDSMIDYAVKSRKDSTGTMIPWQFTSFVAPNGVKLSQTSDFGTPTFRYAGTTIPVGLGAPRLSDADIDVLLSENDPRKVKETITTLADFVNYTYRGNFIFGDGLIILYESSGRSISTTCSGYQTLQRQIGQCASMSSCLHYVLDGDYEEVGYVMVDGHVMAYILCDGLYYLINPVEYVTTVYENNRRPSSWLDDIAHGSNGSFCSADFQDIADSLYGSPIGPDTITHVYTYAGPGDFLRIGFSNFPKGSKAIRWYGPEPAGYASCKKYDWQSQENVVDEDVIVMYPLPQGNRIDFRGIHEDSYTGEQYQ